MKLFGWSLRSRIRSNPLGMVLLPVREWWPWWDEVELDGGRLITGGGWGCERSCAGRGEGLDGR